MEISHDYLPCDGCGLPASPLHIAERVRRLELSTRFRPVHIGVLFVVLAPSVRPDGDFYDLAKSTEFPDPLLEALDIHSCKDGSAQEFDAGAAKAARLAEFQRRGYFLAYVSECPLPENAERATSTFGRLGPTLLLETKTLPRWKWLTCQSLNMRSAIGSSLRLRIAWCGQHTIAGRH